MRGRCDPGNCYPSQLAIPLKGRKIGVQMPQPAQKSLRRVGPRVLVLVALLGATLISWALFHSQLRHWLAWRLFLTSETPQEEWFQDLAGDSADPGEFLKRCWATGKIPHRQMVASFLKVNARANPGWFAGVEPLLLAGTIDADMSVRESALATLQIRQDP